MEENHGKQQTRTVRSGKGISRLSGEIYSQYRNTGKRINDGKKDDTDKLLKSVTDSLNWEIGVLGGTLSLINEKEEKLNKDDINAAVMKLSEALRGKDDKEIAEALESHLLPVLKKVLSAVKEMDLSDCDGQGF